MTDDGFYRAFEARFRGDRALIKARLEIYRPLLEPLLSDAPRRVLDLGCGRGEWLELVGEAGFEAYGVDLDEGMLEETKDLGLDARHGDALDALVAEGDGQLAVVSGFHIAEHLPFDLLRQLIDEAHRVLRPGGLLILETPNAENLRVASLTFHIDPTHNKPLPWEVMAFLAEYAGFEEAKTLFLNAPHDVVAPVGLWDVCSAVSPDYALVARKGGTGLPEFTLPETPGMGRLHELARQFDEDTQAKRETPEPRTEAELDALAREIAELRARIGRLESRKLRTRAFFRRLFSLGK